MDLGFGKVQGQVVEDVQSIYNTASAFAALKADGSVVAWGYGVYGGDCSEVKDQLTGGVQSIYNTEEAFAALKADGMLWHEAWVVMA